MATRSQLWTAHHITERELKEGNATTADICERYGVTARTVYRWRASGLLKGRKMGRCIVYSHNEVKALEKALQGRERGTR